ncbi:MAG TPA: LUD domain-containing protein [Bacteroidales bacterium]|nr:LUD domain-containing protein [Bacteroidales bacterium]HPS62215.1 LUD domain-containing protein [Bacteroidales bacterium]
MEESTSREKILKKVRDALIEKTEVPYPIIDQESTVLKDLNEPPDVTFAEELVRIGGKFVYCESEDEFLSTLESFILEKDWGVLYCQDPVLQKLLHSGGIPFEGNPEALTEARIGITRCEYLVARHGTAMVSSRLSPGRRIAVYPEIHLVMAYASQLVPDLKQALSGLKKKYRDQYPSMVSLISGPSRTADIEKTLVMGAHGPRELYVFLIDDESAAHQAPAG